MWLKCLHGNGLKGNNVFLCLHTAGDLSRKKRQCLRDEPSIIDIFRKELYQDFQQSGKERALLHRTSFSQHPEQFVTRFRSALILRSGRTANYDVYALQRSLNMISFSKIVYLIHENKLGLSNTIKRKTEPFKAPDLFMSCVLGKIPFCCGVKSTLQTLFPSPLFTRMSMSVYDLYLV